MPLLREPGWGKDGLCDRPGVASRHAIAPVGARSGSFARPGNTRGRAKSSESARKGRSAYGTATAVQRKHYGSAPRLMRESPVFAGVLPRSRRWARPLRPSRRIPGAPKTAARLTDRTGRGVAGSAAGRRRRYRPPAGPSGSPWLYRFEAAARRARHWSCRGVRGSRGRIQSRRSCSPFLTDQIQSPQRPLRRVSLRHFPEGS